MVKKVKRVQMVDRRGNIARPYPDAVDKWISAGWTLVDVAEAQADDDQDARKTVMTKDISNGNS